MWDALPAGGGLRPGGCIASCPGGRGALAHASSARPPTHSRPHPQGHIVAASPTFSHRLPNVFSNADAYEPDRFAPPREEDKPLHAYIGFGGGRHACMVRSWGAVGGAGCSAGCQLTPSVRRPAPASTLSPRLNPSTSSPSTTPPPPPTHPGTPCRARTLHTCRSRRCGACCCATLSLSWWSRCRSPTTPPCAPCCPAAALLLTCSPGPLPACPPACLPVRPPACLPALIRGPCLLRVCACLRLHCVWQQLLACHSWPSLTLPTLSHRRRCAAGSSCPSPGACASLARSCRAHESLGAAAGPAGSIPSLHVMIPFLTPRRSGARSPPCNARPAVSPPPPELAPSSQLPPLLRHP